MNVWNKVLMALVAVICIAFGALAAQKYQLIKDNETNIAKLEKQVEDAQAKIATLRREIYGGTVDQPADWRDFGLDEQLKYVRGLQRGSAYVNCQPVEGKKTSNASSGDAMTASIRLDSTKYQLSDFAVGSLVFLFDSGKAYVEGDAQENADDSAVDTVADAVPDEVADVVEDVADSVADVAAPASALPHFTLLGAFTVTASDENRSQVTMTSIGTATEEDIDALVASYRSGNSWVVYVGNLPIDSPQDVAAFVEKEGVADNVADPDYFKRVFTLDDVHNCYDADADAFKEGLSEASRFPVDFQGAIERAWAKRDAANIVRKRALVALNTLTNVIADQYVLIGRGVEDETVLDFADWDAIYESAQQRKKSDSYAERFAKTTDDYNKMNAYCKILADLQKVADNNLATLQKSIKYLLSENAELAAKIAFAQFTALDRIELEASQKTADTSAANVGGDI